MSRPNILLITSDQHRPDCFGYTGRRQINTPHLDSLASQSTRFDCAITPNVLCQPARASLLTGMLPLTHGVYDNQVDMNPAIGEAGWAGQLSSAGYDSKFIGKAHFGHDPRATEWGGPESRADSAKFPEDWNGPFMGFSDVELMILGHWHELLPCEKPPHGQHFERWFWSHEEAWSLWAQDARTGQTANYGNDAAQTWHSALPAEWHSTTWVTERTVNFLQSKQNSDAPFCCWASYPDPHHPFDCPEPWASLHNTADVDISTSHKLDLDDRPWWHRAAIETEPKGKLEKHRRLRKEFSRVPKQTDEQLAAMTANYYNMIAFIDDGVGRILKALSDSGLDDNTIVVFTSDHGELLGDHGLYLKGPMHYDNLLRVGMLMRGPGVERNKTITSPVGTIDLAATFCDLGGASLPSNAQAKSMLPLVKNGTPIRDHVYNEWNLAPARVGVELQLRTIRTETARMTVDLKSGDGELYDLASDPDEMTNLWSTAEAQSLRAELMALVHERPGDIMTELPVHTE